MGPNQRRFNGLTKGEEPLKRRRGLLKGKGFPNWNKPFFGGGGVKTFPELKEGEYFKERPQKFLKRKAPNNKALG